MFKYRIQRWSSLAGKEPACQCRRGRFDPWVRKSPWRRKWQPTPVFLPGESHEERSLAGYDPRGRKESDRTEQLSTQPGIVSFESPNPQQGLSGPRTYVKVIVALCPTLWDPMDCSPPGSSVHGILQARILEWVAISFSMVSS